MQEPNRTRDKIEIKLEPRQVFVLAAGCMVFSGLLFSAGFMLGRTAPDVTVAQAPADLVAEMTAATPEGSAPIPTSAAVGEVEFLFPNALGSRPARKLAPQKSMRLPPQQVRAPSGELAQPQQKIRSRTAGRKEVSITAQRRTMERDLDEDFPLPKSLGSLRAKTASKSLPEAKTSKSQVAKSAPIQAASSRSAVSKVKSAKPAIKPTQSVVEPKNTVVVARDEDKPAGRITPPAEQSSVIPSRLAVKKLVPQASAQSVGTRTPEKAASKKKIQKKAVQPKVAAATVSPAAMRSSGRAMFTLQVKAARTQARASEFIKKLRGLGYKPHQVLVNLPGKGKFYRIRLGRFGTMEEARAFQRKYKRASGATDSGFVTRM